MILAHFSDPHISSVGHITRGDWSLKTLTGATNILLNRGSHYRLEVARALVEDLADREWDHLVITGDLSSLGLREEMEMARSHLIPFQPSRVTVIPGNHDAYTRRVVSERRFQAVFGPCMASDRGEEGEFPLLRLLEGVAIVALNSAVPTPPLVATGRLGRIQLVALEKILAMEEVQERFVVLLVHHHLLFGASPDEAIRKLVDGPSLRALLRDSPVGLLLHGHIHQAYRYTIEGVPVYCPGSVSRVSRDPWRWGRVQYYHIEEGRLTGLTSRSYDPSLGRVVDGEEPRERRPWSGAGEIHEFWEGPGRFLPERRRKGGR